MDEPRKVNVAVLVGSLRKDSINRKWRMRSPSWRRRS